MKQVDESGLCRGGLHAAPRVSLSISPSTSRWSSEICELLVGAPVENDAFQRINELDSVHRMLE